MRSTAFRTALAAGAALAATACGGNSRSEELAYVERPVENIYNEALRSLDRNSWDLAAAQFNEVQRQHPYSPWAQRAMLMSAYAHYRSRDYEKAVSSAQDYISLHPGGDGAPYAYYLVAICQFDQIIDVGRDQARSDLALLALNEVTARFPESDYARDAELKTDMVRDQLAGKEMEVGRYYLERGEHLAAINRFKKVVTDYQTTTHVPEALHRLVESYLSIGLTGQAQQVAAVLGTNYPGSDWYSDSYALMQGQGVELPKAPDAKAGFNLLDRIGKMIF
ncbi:MAG TPA: outer membrane protein assembly factor BamD [Hyphomonadaceae bacterium]|nr:outer membrane protein assembly factor BamD [Hyphomonadaceae bacterium]HPI46951.1 outer membrane protein assembly factor BamD [Hyphomonadaceae bacterium]